MSVYTCTFVCVPAEAEVVGKQVHHNIQSKLKAPLWEAFKSTTPGGFQKHHSGRLKMAVDQLWATLPSNSSTQSALVLVDCIVV